jgi:hypothetical protein
MAKLSPEIRANLSHQKQQLLDLIDEAKSLEFILLERIGENRETISTLEQLTEIAEQASSRLSQLSTLHLRIAEVQPTISARLNASKFDVKRSRISGQRSRSISMFNYLLSFA